MTTINANVRFLRATADDWTDTDPVLPEGQPGWQLPSAPGETDGVLKIGDGVTPWSELPVFTSGGGGGGNASLYRKVDGEYVLQEGVVIALGDEPPDPEVLPYDLFVRVDETAPAAPAGVVASPAPQMVTLSWAHNPDPDLDYFEVRIDAEPWVNVGPDESYVFEDLVNGEDHDFSVRGVDLSGNVGPATTVTAAAQGGQYVQKGSASGIGTSLVVTLEEGDPTPGDVLFIFYAVTDDKATIETPSEAQNVNNVNVSGDTSAMKVWRYEVQPGDTDEIVLTKTGADVDQDAVVIEVSGVNVGNPIHTSVPDKQSNPGLSLESGPIITSIDELMGFIVWRTEHDDPVFAVPPSNVDEVLINTGRLLVARCDIATQGSFNSLASWTNSTRALSMAVVTQ